MTDGGPQAEPIPIWKLWEGRPPGRHPGRGRGRSWPEALLEGSQRAATPPIATGRRRFWILCTKDRGKARCNVHRIEIGAIATQPAEPRDIHPLSSPTDFSDGRARPHRGQKLPRFSMTRPQWRHLIGGSGSVADGTVPLLWVRAGGSCPASSPARLARLSKSAPGLEACGAATRQPVPGARAPVSLADARGPSNGVPEPRADRVRPRSCEPRRLQRC